MKDILPCLLGTVASFVFGGFCLFRPEIMWKLEHYFDVKNGEPSDWYLDKIRLLGTGMVVLGMVMAGYTLLMIARAI